MLTLLYSFLMPSQTTDTGMGQNGCIQTIPEIYTGGSGGLKLLGFLTGSTHTHGGLWDAMAWEAGVPCWEPTFWQPLFSFGDPRTKTEAHSKDHVLVMAECGTSVWLIHTDTSQILTKISAPQQFLASEVALNGQWFQKGRLQGWQGLGQNTKCSLCIPGFSYPCLRDLVFGPLRLLRDWYSSGYSQ